MSKALEALPEIGDAVIDFFRKEIGKKYLSKFKEEGGMVPPEDFNTLVICLLAGIVAHELDSLSSISEINIDILVKRFNAVLKKGLQAIN